LYNTLLGLGGQSLGGGCVVVKCPECAAVIDVDEDEVEEGEILSCPECEVELEVVQISPVQLNVLSDDEDYGDDEEDEEEEEEEDFEEEEEEEFEDEEEEK
jgi:alpha-aminoadipate carrier protein LysW